MRLRTLILASAALALSFACGKTPEPEPKPEPKPTTIPVTSVSLSKSELTLDPGASETLTATVVPSNATDKTVTWSTSNSGVATVENGKVTAVKEGEATIKATAGGKEASCKVTVKKAVIAVEAVTLNKAELALEPGASETLTATVAPDNATDKTVTWGTSNAEVATVDNGKVTAVKGGDAFITATAGGKSAVCKVSVKDNVFEVTPNKVNVDASGGSFVITVKTTHDYYLSSRPEWITEILAENKVHTFEVSANPEATERNGVIVFCDDKGTCIPCSVTQAGNSDNPDETFSVFPSSIQVGATVSTFDVTVTCPSTYQLSSTPDWITEKAVNGKVHTFEVAENTSSSERSGVVVFCDDEGTCLPCSVRQKGKEEGTSEDIDWTKGFIHRSLFMRFTATWCGWCPLMAESARLAQNKRPGKILVLNIHTTSSNLEFKGSSILENVYSINSWPSGVMDGRKSITNYTDAEKTSNIIVGELDNIEQAFNPVTTAGWSSSSSGQSLSIDLEVYVKKAGTYKATVVLVENGIIGYQADYEKGETSNYHHDNIARVAVTKVDGEIFTAKGDRHTEKKSYNVTIPSSYNTGNMEVLVYVQRAYGDGVPVIAGSDYSGWYIDNCNSGKLGVNVPPAIAKEGSGGGNEDVIGGNPINW